jgi:hypothetical protein
MSLLLFLTADYANLTADGKLNVMGIFDTINSINFPARHSSLFLIIKLVPELGEFGQTRELSVRLQDADGKDIMGISNKFTVPTPDGGKKPEVSAIFEIKDLILPKEGPYQFVVLVDKDFKGDLTLYANKIVPPVLKEN